MNLPNFLTVAFIVAMTALIACSPKKPAKDFSPEAMMAREVNIAKLYKATERACFVPIAETPRATDLQANLQTLEWCANAASRLTEAALVEGLTVDQAFTQACISSTIDMLGAPADDATSKEELNFCAKQLETYKKPAK